MKLNITEEQVESEANGFIFDILKRNEEFEPKVKIEDISFYFASKQEYKIMIEKYVAIISHTWYMDENEDNLLYSPESLVKILISIYKLMGRKIDASVKEKWYTEANTGDKYYLIMYERGRMF
jgi:hypothetical protein